MNGAALAVRLRHPPSGSPAGLEITKSPGKPAFERAFFMRSHRGGLIGFFDIVLKAITSSRILRFLG